MGVTGDCIAGMFGIELIGATAAAGPIKSDIFGGGLKASASLSSWSLFIHFFFSGSQTICARIKHAPAIIAKVHQLGHK